MNSTPTPATHRLRATRNTQLPRATLARRRHHLGALAALADMTAPFTTVPAACEWLAAGATTRRHLLVTRNGDGGLTAGATPWAGRVTRRARTGVTHGCAHVSAAREGLVAGCAAPKLGSLVARDACGGATAGTGNDHCVCIVCVCWGGGGGGGFRRRVGNE